MSGKYTGVTFANQKVSPSDDAIIRRAILPDGKLTGCDISYSGSTLTMSAGHLMVCGRQIRIPAAMNWPVVDATSGFARLVLTIDLTRTATKENFDQVVDSIEYATSKNGFATLDQTDINGAGTRYQVAACIVSLGTGGITSIVSQLEKCEVGAGLNFKVVGGTTQPNDPKENTIWVNTSEEITGWAFSVSAPASPSGGMVWFEIGLSSVVAFNALKKNRINVYPVSVKQYVSGNWQNKTAKSYQNGAWVNWWNGEIYDSGNLYEQYTGGWTHDETTTIPKITYNADSITFHPEVQGISVKIRTAKRINVNSFSSLVFEGTATNPNDTSLVGILDSTKKIVASTVLGTGSTYSVDIKNITGDYYIFLQCSSSARPITIRKLYMR